MDELLQILLALGVAVVVTALELVTDKYPRTFQFLAKCKSFYIYIGIYGVIAAFITIFMDYLVASKAITLEGPMIGNGWAQAVAIGIAVKAFLHIRLFNVNTGTQSFPVGLETIVLLFEPWLLRQILLCHWRATNAFIKPKAINISVPNDQTTKLDVVKAKVLNGIPKSFSDIEKMSFKDDVNKAETVVDVMEMYLSLVGPGPFKDIFPD